MKEDLKLLGQEVLIDIIKQLMDGKKFEDIRKNLLTDRERSVIDSLHVMMCNREHLSETCAAGCGYYLEGDDFSGHDHTKWTEKYKEIRWKYSIVDIDTIIFTLDTVVRVKRELLLNIRASVPLALDIIDESLR